jgi:hypothetical protein
MVIELNNAVYVLDSIKFITYTKSLSSYTINISYEDGTGASIDLKNTSDAIKLKEKIARMLKDKCRYCRLDVENL